MTKKLADYDIYYKYKSYMVMAVAATSAADAKRRALNILMNMPKEELAERFLAAVDVEPDFCISGVEYIEDVPKDAMTENDKKILLEVK